MAFGHKGNGMTSPRADVLNPWRPLLASTWHPRFVCASVHPCMLLWSKRITIVHHRLSFMVAEGKLCHIAHFVTLLAGQPQLICPTVAVIHIHVASRS